jgi:hypothetical protein
MPMLALTYFNIGRVFILQSVLAGAAAQRFRDLGLLLPPPPVPAADPAIAILVMAAPEWQDQLGPIQGVSITMQGNGADPRAFRVLNL